MRNEKEEKVRRGKSEKGKMKKFLAFSAYAQFLISNF